jgi:hypothetical protein
MLSNILSAIRARSTFSLALYIASALFGVASMIIANNPYGTSLGAIPYSAFLFQLFAYEILMIGSFVVFALFLHYSFHSESIRKIWPDQRISPRSAVIIGISNRDRKLARFIIYGAMALSGVSLLVMTLPWIQFTGVFLRDGKVDSSYRRHLMLGAYDAEARGEYLLAIERLTDFRNKFPDRAELNNIDATIKELSSLSKLSQQLTNHADVLEKRRGFALDVIDLRIAAAATMPSVERIDELKKSIATIDKFIDAAERSIENCKKGNLKISQQDVGKSLVAIGVISRPERLIPAVENGGRRGLFCGLFQYQEKNKLLPLLDVQWQRQKIAKYEEEIRKFNRLRPGEWRSYLKFKSNLGRDGLSSNNDEIGDANPGEQDNKRELDTDGLSFDDTIGPVDFSTIQNTATGQHADKVSSIVEVFVRKDLGVFVCWKNRKKVQDIILAGVREDLLMSRARACNFAVSGGLLRLNLENPEIVSSLTSAMADLLEKVERGDRVSSLSRESSRHTLCVALLTINNIQDNSLTWLRHCQLEVILDKV